MKFANCLKACAGAVALAVLAGLPAGAVEDDPWPGIAKDMFAGKEIGETQEIVLDAPYRAEDAGVVPISVKLPAGLAEKVTKLTLIIDKNPMPVVAAFAFGPGAGTGERVISTLVRFDMYSNLRAIAETSDGKLVMVSRFVKAASGPEDQIASRPPGRRASRAACSPVAE